MRLFLIEMHVAEYPAQTSDFQFAPVSEIKKQRPVLNPVMWNAQKNVGASLILRHVKFAIANVALDHRSVAIAYVKSITPKCM